MEIAHGIGHFFKGSQAAYAGVAGDVHFAKGLGSLGGGGLHLLGIGHVGHAGNDLSVVFFAQLFGGLFHFGGQIHHAQLGAILGIRGGDAFAQAYRSASDQSNFTSQLSHSNNLLFSLD